MDVHNLQEFRNKDVLLTSETLAQNLVLVFYLLQGYVC